MSQGKCEYDRESSGSAVSMATDYLLFTRKSRCCLCIHLMHMSFTIAFTTIHHNNLIRERLSINHVITHKKKLQQTTRRFVSFITNQVHQVIYRCNQLYEPKGKSVPVLQVNSIVIFEIMFRFMCDVPISYRGPVSHMCNTLCKILDLPN